MKNGCIFDSSLTQHKHNIMTTQLFNLFFNGVKLNKKPLTEIQADNEIRSIIMNYGYKPNKVKI